MAPTSFLFVFSIATTFLVSSYAEPRPLKPSGSSVILPVKKNLTTLQYYTSLQTGSTLQRQNLAIDLGGVLVWVNCEDYVSSSYRPLPCGTHKCENFKASSCIVECYGSPRPGCTNNTCGGYSPNPFGSFLYSGSLGEDSITVMSTDGSHRKVPDFFFSCADSSALEGLASDISGIAGLAKTNNSLHTQIALALKLPDKFSLCMPSSNGHKSGSLFVGGGPIYMPSYKKDMSELLTTTPFITNLVSTGPVYSKGDHSDEYFIDVKSIKIDGKILNIKSSLLAIDKNGIGGAKISTVTNFTILHSSIYKVIIREFVKKASSMKIKRVASVKPFKACFNSKTITDTATGPNMPTIDLVLQSEEVYWRIYGHNSMVRVNEDVMCLAFMDGGKEPRTSIVLGGHQLEDNLLQFDLVSSMLGFSNSLLLHNTSCSH